MSSYYNKSDDLKDIAFNVIDWQSLDLKISIRTNEDDLPEYKKEKQFVIRAFGRTENEESVCLEVRDFKPYFYFEIEEQDDNCKWKNITSKICENKIKFQVIKKELKENHINAEEDSYITETDPEKKKKEITEKMLY